MTTLYNGADTAKPGSPLPKGTKILCAYVGAKDLPGQPDARHVWTLDEWNLYLDPNSHLFGGPELRSLPIFVHDYPGDPAQLAINAVDACIDLGWSANEGRFVCIDLETLVDPQYVSSLNIEVRALGFRLMKYGSAHFINQNPPVDGGTWMALLANRRPAMLPPGTVGQQWHFGTEWDQSVFSEFVYANCGRGIRRTEQ